MTGTSYGEEVSFTTPSYLSGNGTELSPYEISSLSDLQYLSEHSDLWASGTYFIQTANIDASATSTWNPDGSRGYYGFSPIGNGSAYFRGNYDGQGYTISNLYINRTGTYYCGLFGYANGGTLSNIILSAINFSCMRYAGALAGNASSIDITNCTSSGSLTGNNRYTGGLIGYMSSGTVYNCSSSCSVTITTSYGYYSGGLLGYIYGSDISQSFSSGNVSSASTKNGGLIGYANGTSNTLQNCYSKSNVTKTGGADTQTGAFIGYSTGANVDNCYCTGSVNFPDASATSDRGFIGSKTAGTTSNNFFDVGVSNQTTGNGATAKSTSDMKDPQTFADAGWELGTIWGMKSDYNDGYPNLDGENGSYGTNTWTGTVSSVWENPSNWDQAEVPNATQNTVIASSANNPLIGNGIGASTNKLTINNGATLTVADGGSLITSSTITNNGGINIQRTVSESAWHLISVPNNSTTTQLFTGDYLQTWSESAGEWSDIIPTTDPMVTAKGYSLWAMPEVETTYTFEGTPNTGDKSISITCNDNGSNDGANLLGNPYPSSIDWDRMRLDYGAVYYWNGTAYVSWNDGGSGSQYVAPMQGFFVVTNQNETFSLSNSKRSHEGAASFYKESNQKDANNSLILAASGNDYSDKLYITLDESGTRQYDKRTDAYKFLSSSPDIAQLYTYGGDDILSIDHRPPCSEIQLGFMSLNSGQYSIRLEEAFDFTSVVLWDTKFDIKTDLMSHVYSFNYIDNEDDKRFKIVLGTTGIEEESMDDTFVFLQCNIIIIQSERPAQRITLTDIAGKTLGVWDNTENIPAPSTTGVYLVTVETNQNRITKKIIVK